MNPVNSDPQSDLQKPWFRARISTLDNVMIATGELTPQSPGAPGHFYPDFEFQPPNAAQPLNKTPHKEVLADLGTHQVRLQDWSFCKESENCPHPLYRKVHFDFLWPE
jgi:hypothetical protein